MKPHRTCSESIQFGRFKLFTTPSASCPIIFWAICAILCKVQVCSKTNTHKQTQKTKSNYFCDTWHFVPRFSQNLVCGEEDENSPGLTNGLCVQEKDQGLYLKIENSHFNILVKARFVSDFFAYTCLEHKSISFSDHLYMVHSCSLIE